MNAPDPIRFTKMHGLGNDYLYVDCFAQPLNGVDRTALARAMSDRHRGVGADGLILICPPDAGVKADVRMEMYNADGSRGEMCGNGIRCVAKYVLEHRLFDQSRDRQGAVRVQTDRGVLVTEAQFENDIVRRVRVDMGPPILDPSQIPVVTNGDRCVKQPLQVKGKPLTMTCVSMGNPHAVFFVDSLDRIDLKELGPLIERQPAFPNRVNAHFVTVQSRGEAIMKTWERGTGITQACGTGACAVLVAGVLEGRLDRAATLHLPGGDLEIEWPDDSSSVFKTGPAEEVFSGEWVV
jgi:diaminopimelate epimerase